MEIKQDRKLGKYAERPFAVRFFVFVLVYTVTSYCSITLLRVPGEGISFFWPGTGLALTALDGLGFVPRERVRQTDK